MSLAPVASLIPARENTVLLDKIQLQIDTLALIMENHTSQFSILNDEQRHINTLVTLAIDLNSFKLATVAIKTKFEALKQEIIQEFDRLSLIIVAAHWQPRMGLQSPRL